MYLNKTVLCGRVGSKPEIFTGGKSPVARFSLATQSFYKKDKETKSKTTWHKIVIYDPNLVEIVKKYIDTGCEVYVEGKNENSSYTDANQVERTNYFVIAKTVILNKGKNTSENQEADKPEIQESSFTPEDEFNVNDDLPY